MKINGIEVLADEGITFDEIEQIVSDEQALWKTSDKELGAIMLTLDGDEIVVKAVELSPIKRVRRITGYLSTEDRFNAAKQEELKARVSHV